MDLKNNRSFQILLRVFLLLNFLVCPYMFIGAMFAPQIIEFLEPVVCPEGMEMERQLEDVIDSEGDRVTQATLHCVDGRESKDVSWKMILIMLGFPALGVVVFFYAPTSSLKKEEDKYKINPDGMG